MPGISWSADLFVPIKGFRSIELGMTEEEVNIAVKKDPKLYDNIRLNHESLWPYFARGIYFDFMGYKRQPGILFYQKNTKVLGTILLIFPNTNHKETGTVIRKLRRVLIEKFGEPHWTLGQVGLEWEVDGDEDLEGDHLLPPNDNFIQAAAPRQPTNEFVSWEQDEIGRGLQILALRPDSATSNPMILIFDEAFGKEGDAIKRYSGNSDGNSDEDIKKYADEF